MQNLRLFRFVRALFSALTVWAISSAVNAEPATIISDTSLYQRPSYQAPVVAPLANGSQVELVARQGGWKQVKTESSSGWVRAYQVRSGVVNTDQQETSSGGFFSGLAALSRKASGLFSSDRKDYSFQRTATIGVRGLSEEELKNARPDFDQVKRMETYRSKSKPAKKFARKGGRKAIKLSHLPKSSAEK